MSNEPLKLKIDISKGAGDDFCLPLTTGYDYDLTVDWGDGSAVEAVGVLVGSPTEDFTIVHDYSGSHPAVEYSVSITVNDNKFGGLQFANCGTARPKVIELESWGDVEWKTFNNAFNGCANLDIIAIDHKDSNTSGVVSFLYAWRGCSALVSFPEIDVSGGVDFRGTWCDCTSLQSFPNLIFTNGEFFGVHNQYREFYGAWKGCTGLTSFPALAFPSGVDFSNAWYGCSGLAEFPSGIDISNGRYFGGAWMNCTSLTSFPEINFTNAEVLGAHLHTRDRGAWAHCTGLTSFPKLVLPNVIQYDVAWVGCTGLTEFPEIDTSNGISFRGTWQSCTGLTTFPTLNFSNAINLGGEYSGRTQGAWAGCTGLTSFPLLSFPNVVNYMAAWRGCSSLVEFPEINVSEGVDFRWTWSGCSSLQSFPALTFTKGSLFGMNNNRLNNTGAWANCTGLTSFPAINFPSGEDFSNAWYGCSGLAEFPSGIDISNGRYFGGAWMNCTSLTSFPEINFTNAEVLGFCAHYRDSGAWANCTGLTSFPKIDFPLVTQYDVAWLGCNNLGKLFENTSWDRLGTTCTITHADHKLTNGLKVIFKTDAEEEFIKSEISNITEDTFDIVVPETIGESGINGFYSTLFPEINTSNGISFLGTWQGCSSLTSESFENLEFSNATALGKAILAGYFRGAWLGCTGLTSFPFKSFPKVTEYSFAWRDCNGLTSFPDIDVSEGTNFEGTWSSCISLQSFPALTFTKGSSFGLVGNSSTGTGSWAYCTGLTSFPAINFPSGVDFTYSWYACSGLTEFPNIDISNGKYFGGAWQYCSSLRSFPMLDFSNAERLSHSSNQHHLRGAWAYCTGLNGYDFPLIDIRNVIDGTICFAGVTLSSKSYSDLLKSLAENNTNTGVNFHGGNSEYNQDAVESRVTTLMTDRGWNITDGGLTPIEWTEERPSTASVGSTTATLRVKTDKPGKVYYMILKRGDPKPTSEQVKNGTKPDGATMVTHGEVVMNGGS